MTVQVWLKAICRRRVFEQGPDTPRIREAFAMLAERSRRWPSPADFLDCLPSNVVPFKASPKLEHEGTRQARMASFAEIAKMLAIRPDDNPESPDAA